MEHSFVASAAHLIDYYQLNQLFEQSKKIGKQSGTVWVSWSVGAFGAVELSGPGRRARVKPRTQIPYWMEVGAVGCGGCRCRVPTCATCGAGVYPVGRHQSRQRQAGQQKTPSVGGWGGVPRPLKRVSNLLPTIHNLIFEQSN